MFSKPDVDYFSKIDADPKEGPAELGTFRECVVPILEYGKADLVSGGPYRLNDFIEIDSAPGHSPGHVFFKLESKGQRAAFIGDVWHHLLQVYYPDWNFPKNSDVAQAVVSRRKVLDYCASSGALVFPGHVGLPFAGYVEGSQGRLQAEVRSEGGRSVTLSQMIHVAAVENSFAVKPELRINKFMPRQRINWRELNESAQIIFISKA